MPNRSLPFLLLTALLSPAGAGAESLPLKMQEIVDWKAVYGRVEARDRLPARARIGGTLTQLSVAEGDLVEAGAVLAEITDEKLGFQLSALAAREVALEAELSNAEAELLRGETLAAQGVITAQRLEALRTAVAVLKGQIAALKADADGVRQAQAEGAVRAPAAGRVLDVPLAEGAVVLPGETVALIASGGTFLRLAVPERHALSLAEGAEIFLETGAGAGTGRLAKIYPLIENGRVIADVDVPGLSDRYIDARVLVRLPVGTREGLLVPPAALRSRAGLDFVAVQTGADGAWVWRLVVPAKLGLGGAAVEVLSGLQPGDVILSPAPEDGPSDE